MPAAIVPAMAERQRPAYRVLFFGTYDVRTHPRVQALQDGLRAAGDIVEECNVPLGLDTTMRVRILKRPYLLPVLVGRIAVAWFRLWRRSRRSPAPDAVVVGYLGHFDVHLARRLWPRTIIALDHMISAADTALDRGARPGLVTRLLARLDRAALRRADVPFVDTPEHLDIVPLELRDKAVVVPVGAPDYWFHEPQPHADGPLRVAFFGLYTPLQGAVAIGEAIALVAGADVEFTMIGHGQDLSVTRAAAAGNPRVTWHDWIAAVDLPALVAEHDVCLGIFGVGPKARRVVPNKVYQGAAAGCAIITSDTPPQRSMLDGAAVFVPPGDGAALATALTDLAKDRDRVEKLRQAAYERADAAFRPARVVGPLRERLRP
jgi:glycosyltransferase involved in cell wall biosynthesis